VPAGGHAGAEDHPGGLAGAEAFRDDVPAPWRAEGIAEVGGRTPGGGYRVRADELFPAVELESAGADADEQQPRSELDAQSRAGFARQLHG